MQRDKGMRILPMVGKLSLVFETHIVFYNCIFCSRFTKVNMASDFFFQDGTISYSNSSISIHGKTLPIAKYGLLARCRGNRDDIEPNADGWKRKFLMG